MYVIVGLGNPDQEYLNTRHNAGWLMLDYLQSTINTPEWHAEKKFSALVSEGVLSDQKVMLVKPTTYMNDSGKAVSAIMNFYKLTPDKLIVVHDDKDLTWGEIKIQSGRGDAGHNGVKSITAAVSTKEYTRVRLGVKNELTDTIDTANFVLGKFTPSEIADLSGIFESATKQLLEYIK